MQLPNFYTKINNIHIPKAIYHIVPNRWYIGEVGDVQLRKIKMKCLRCKSRGEKNPPDYKLHQQNKDTIAMVCPKCGYVGGHLENKKRS